MNLYLRVLILFLRSFFKPRIKDILTPSILRFYVLPNDLDFNGHMNNGRYFTIMDLGRFDLVLRSGLMRMMLKQKSVPVLGSAKIRYRLPLMPFEAFNLETRILCWDDKWFYMEQRFIKLKGKKSGAVAAIALLKGSFYNSASNTTVPTNDVLHMIDYQGQSPAIPDHIVKWQTAEDGLKDITRAA